MFNHIIHHKRTRICASIIGKEKNSNQLYKITKLALEAQDEEKKIITFYNPEITLSETEAQEIIEEIKEI
jgi:spore germination cell wall hydrolase CwlJ-like protein